jgi:hypothetical protein
MKFIWYSRGKFVGVSDFLAHGRGDTSREGMKTLRLRAVNLVQKIDKILATNGPEQADQAAQREIAEAHPKGLSRHCDCTHASEIYCTPRSAPGISDEAIDSILRQLNNEKELTPDISPPKTFMRKMRDWVKM